MCCVWVCVQGERKYHLKDEGHSATDANHLVKAQLQILLEGQSKKTNKL